MTSAELRVWLYQPFVSEKVWRAQVSSDVTCFIYGGIAAPFSEYV